MLASARRFGHSQRVDEYRERAFVRATLSAAGSFVALTIALFLVVIAVALVNETITIRVAPSRVEARSRS